MIPLGLCCGWELWDSVGNGLDAEDEKATRDRETHWAVVEKLQARSKEGPKQVGSGRLKNRLVGC